MKQSYLIVKDARVKVGMPGRHLRATSLLHSIFHIFTISPAFRFRSTSFCQSSMGSEISFKMKTALSGSSSGTESEWARPHSWHVELESLYTWPLMPRVIAKAILTLLFRSTSYSRTGPIFRLSNPHAINCDRKE